MEFFVNVERVWEISLLARPVLRRSGWCLAGGFLYVAVSEWVLLVSQRSALIPYLDLAVV